MGYKRDNFKSENWLELKNIEIGYGEKKVVKKINLRLFLGENTVLIGANGSGKSTLLKAICKIKYPLYSKQSYIKIFGENNPNIWEMRSQVGFVLSELDERIKRNVLFKDLILSGFQGTFGILNKRIISKQQIDSMNEVLRKLDINIENTYYHKLSEGQKRLALIARSLVSKPKVLILDEPTAMLDLKANYKLQEAMSMLTSNANITLLYVTNDINNIIKETDRVICLKDGEFINDGKPVDILNSLNISKLYDYNIEIKNIDGYWRTYPRSNNDN